MEVSTPERTHSEDYPTVARWVGRGPAHHLWRQLLSIPVDPTVRRPTVADTILEPLEFMTAAIDHANPQGRARFVSSRFRDSDLSNVLSARLELVWAFNLVVQNVAFEFGAEPEPDLVCGRDTPTEVCLEITRRALDDFDRLRDDLEEEAFRKNASLEFRVDPWPITFPDRNLLRSRISTLIDESIATGTDRSAALPELGEGASVVSRPGGARWGLGRVTITHAALNPTAKYLHDLARKVRMGVEGAKGSQARHGRWSSATMLVVDVSTARHLLLLRPQEITSWLAGMALDWAESPYGGVAICFTHLQGYGIHGAYRFRPRLDETHRNAFEHMISTVGLTAVGNH